MPFVYILKSTNFAKTYVGSTTNIERRIFEHNKGYSTFSKKYKPWILLYKEECDKLINARQREKYFKSAAGRQFIKKLFEKEA